MKQLSLIACLLALVLVSGCGEGKHMAGLSPLALEFGGGATTDSVDFGYLPRVSLTNNRLLSVSSWIYYDADETGNYHRIISTRGGSTLTGWTVRVTNVAGADVYLIFDAAMWSGAQGVFYVAPEALSTDAWTHVVVTYDSTSTSNTPGFYVNGAAKTTSTSTSPSGSFVDGAGHLIIGNMSTSDVPYNQAFDGKIFDARIYNRILTAAEVTTLYNGGTPSMSAGYSVDSNGTPNALYNGSLVFHGVAVRTGDLSSYVDATLPGKVFEAQFLKVGEAHGTVTGRTAP